MPSFNDLIKIPSKDDVLNTFVGLLRLAGFPVSSWHSGSVLRETVESESSYFNDLHTSVQKIGKAGLIKLAAEIDDAWVDLVADNVFAEERKPAIYTQGKATLYDDGGIGPLMIQPGTFWIANADKSLRFVNVDEAPVMVPLGGSAVLTFQAESPGTNWNVGNEALTEILTPQPGLRVVNGALDTGTWITQQGANTESNAALVQRCLDKWATLGSGANEAAYRYYATSSSSEITRVRVYSPGAGSVRVVVAGDAGPVSAAALAKAASIIEAKRPLGVPDIQTLNATVFSQVVAGALAVRYGRDPAAALAKAQGAGDALARATAIGAKKVSREQIIRALLVDDLEDLELAQPATDFALGDNDVWVPSYSLTAA